MKKYLLITCIFIFLLSTANGCNPADQHTSTPLAEPTQEGKTLIVTSSSDSGPGTLRQALEEAQVGDTITFDTNVFPPDSPATIYLKTHGEANALPSISKGSLTIDASNAGVIIDGSQTSGDWVNCIVIESNENIIRGLQVINFPGSGFSISNGAQKNMLGGDRSIGAGPIGQGNISCNNRTAIDVQGVGTSQNTISGNFIGVFVEDASKKGGSETGVYLAGGASNNTIGPNNIIAHNVEGIQVNGMGSKGNTITQNSLYDNQRSVMILKEGNENVAPPDIIGFDILAGTITISTCPKCMVEIYSDEFDQGKTFEISGRANESGFLTIIKGTSFNGPHLTASSTDTSGNTSSFSMPTTGTSLSTPFMGSHKLIQLYNSLPTSEFEHYNSSELADNRNGTMSAANWTLEPEVFPEGILDASHILNLGFKRFRFTLNSLETPKVDWQKSEFEIEIIQNQFVNQLVDSGVKLTYVLSFWDTDWIAKGNQPEYPRFQTEEEINRYLEYVRFIVQNFKGRVSYYEIWNEPNHPDLAQVAQYITVEEYIKLANRVIPVIREEDADTKIVVGGTTSLIDSNSQTYFFKILESDIMPLVDVISWHPMYGSSPAYNDHLEYYQTYPELVQKIKKTAWENGFSGEFEADEIHWPTSSQPEPGWPTYSNTQSVKYLTRSILMHLGSGVTVTQILLVNNPQQIRMNQFLSTLMSDAKPQEIPVSVTGVDFPLASYGFFLPGGNSLIAIWNDDSAVDYDPGIASTMIIPGFAGWKATGFDVLDGIEQELVTSNENDDLVIQNLLIKDYPIIIRLSK